MQEDFNTSAADRISVILDRLSKVPEGRKVVDFLKKNAVDITLLDTPINYAASTLTITGIKDGIYQYLNPVIVLKKDLSDDNLLQAIVHESQHLQQHLSGVGNPDRILSRDDYILFYRAAEADAQAACTLVTWKLKEAGDAGPWKATAWVGYKDVCDAFEDAVAKDPAAADDGRARRAAFDAWFSNTDRLASYNKATVDSMIPFLDLGRTKIFTESGLKDGTLDDSWLQKLHQAADTPYLLQPGLKTPLEDPAYRRDTDKRPPANDDKKNADKQRAPEAPKSAGP